MPTQDEPSRRDVEKQIEDLKNEKNRIEDDLRRLDANEKRILEQRRKMNEESASSTARPKDDNEKDGENKEGDKSDEEGKDKEGAEEKEKEEAKKRMEERKRDSDGRPQGTDKRSRNLFGSMLGHLARAKKGLDDEKGLKTTELNKKAQERLKEKLLLSQMNIADYRKDQFDKQRTENQAKMNQLDKAIEAKELVLLRKRLEDHYKLMMNFIRTKAEPTIFYLPAKHIKSTEAMLEDTRSAIKRKIASLKIELQPSPDDDDENASPEDVARRTAAAAAVAAAETLTKPSDDKASPKKDAGSDDEKESAKDKDSDDEKKDAKSEEGGSPKKRRKTAKASPKKDAGSDDDKSDDSIPKSKKEGKDADAHCRL